MNSRIVIAAYRAKQERMNDLLQILKAKRKFMLEAGYYSPRAAISMTSMKDPELVIEVFEWTSHEAISRSINWLMILLSFRFSGSRLLGSLRLLIRIDSKPLGPLLPRWMERRLTPWPG